MRRNFRVVLVTPAFARRFACGDFASPSELRAPCSRPKKAAGGQAQTRLALLDPALLQPSMMKLKAPAQYEVHFVTTAGEFTIRVTRAWSPNGADLFYNLVRHHFYDGAASFFRVLPGFMAQFGLSPYPEVSDGMGGGRISGTTAWCRAIIAALFRSYDGPKPQYAHHAGVYQFRE